LAVRPSHRRNEHAVARDVAEPDLARAPGVVALEPLGLTCRGGSLRLDRGRCSIGPAVELSLGAARGPGRAQPEPRGHVARQFADLAAIVAVREYPEPHRLPHDPVLAVADRHVFRIFRVGLPLFLLLEELVIVLVAGEPGTADGRMNLEGGDIC